MFIKHEKNDLVAQVGSIVIPISFVEVQYNCKRIPGVEQQTDLRLGANCQLYVYELLRYFGLSIPNFRSSELWADQAHTQGVTEFEPLDIMLYHNHPKAYGAHVGLYVGSGLVLHLSLANGLPRMECHSELIQQEKYACFIGAKRLLK